MAYHWNLLCHRIAYHVRIWAFSDGIAFYRVTDFSDADKSFCADHPSANTFPRTAVGKLHGLSITEARRCMLVRTAWAISGSENKVKLSSASSIAFERSSRSDDHCRPESSKTRFENTSRVQTTSCSTRFEKRVSRIVMLNCFQTQEKNYISIKIVSLETRLQIRDLSFCLLKPLYSCHGFAPLGWLWRLKRVCHSCMAHSSES